MSSGYILSDNGASSGSAGLKTGGGNDGTLLLQTTTAGGVATTAVTVDNAQNVGVGVTPSAWGSGTKAIEAQGGSFYSVNTSNIAMSQNSYLGASNFIYKNTAAASYYGQSAGAHLWYNAPSGTAGNAITFTAAMTLDASGNLLVGTTTAGANGTNAYTAGSLCLGGTATTAGYKYCIINVNTGGSGAGLSYQYGAAERAAIFWNQSNDRLFAFVGNSATGVYMANSATSWTANSDERLKTDLVPIENAAQKVSTLRAVTGRYKTDEEGVSRSFLIAQDVQAVLPEAVSVGSMPMSEDQTQYLGVSYTDVIPLLVAAIKEQQALITSLTERITALEAK